MPMKKATITSFLDSCSQITNEIYSLHYTCQTGHLVVSERFLHEKKKKKEKKRKRKKKTQLYNADDLCIYNTKIVPMSIHSLFAHS